MAKAVETSRQRKISATGKRDAARVRPKVIKAGLSAPPPPASSETRQPVLAPAAAPPASAPRIAEEARAGDEARAKYVYCVIRSDRPLAFGAIGVGVDPAEVYTVEHRDIAAVVSDTPAGLYEPTRHNVLAHERVNEAVMREHTVIPMSFGTVFKTRDDILQLLRSAYDAFADVLAKLDDKLEYGLKVLWDRDRAVDELELVDEDIRRLKAEISSRQGSTYFARMQYGRLVDAALQARSDQYAQQIVDALRPLAVASRANRPIGDRMILNAAFLVRRDREADFDAAVKEIGSKYEHLAFKYTGPWPPYNFVNIRLKLERA